MKKNNHIKYNVCKTCVLDTSDKNIKFNEFGVCDYCLNYEKNIRPYLKKNLENSSSYFSKLKKNLLVHKKKNNLEYDCLIGISGGIDSSYLLYFIVCELKLNPLLFHVDTGWNNKIAISNIEKFIDKFDLDLHTEVIDWNEIKDLKLSFFKAQVPTVDAIQDHAIWAATFKYAKKNNFKYILTGGNLHTEGIREPIYWHYHAGDMTQIRDIHKKFGTLDLKKFPTCDILNYQLIYKYIYNIKIIQPLNYIQYSKSEAIKLMKNEIDWKDYGAKHHESNFTKFIEGYWLPTKFDIDKRRVHLSSLIMSKEISRDEALKKLETPSFNLDELNKDFNYVAIKLGISSEELRKIYDQENKYHYNYRSKEKFLNIILWFMKLTSLEKRIMR